MIPIRKKSVIQQIHRHLGVQKNVLVASAPTQNTNERSAGDRNAHDRTNGQKDSSASEQITKNAIMPKVNDHGFVDRSRFPELMTASASDGHKSIQTTESTGKINQRARWNPFKFV